MNHRISALIAILFATRVLADTSLTVHVDKVEHPISPTLHGIFFEDVNFGADGGLCPELVKNGSFEFTPDPVMGWHRVDPDHNSDNVTVATDHPLNENNPHFLRMTIDAKVPPANQHGITNDGFRGMGVTADAEYIFSAYARTGDEASHDLDIRLDGSDNKAIATGKITMQGTDWKKYSITIKASRTDSHAHLIMIGTTPGTIDLDMVSLYPINTFNGHGLRPDLVQLLKDLHPKFMRFPGGCIVEGRILDNRYQWKNTIGDVAQRKVIFNRWNNEFSWRSSPDYFQSYKIGFYDYFQLCEDIGASPLPILNCGMACQFNTGELAPVDQLQPYIQDALDLIEFANGPVDSLWGKKRAEMGHPALFNLKRMGIGNEQWGPHYIERYKQIAAAVKAKYPEIEIVSAAGPSPDGVLFDYAWKELSNLHADILDEHYYAGPDWFIQHADRYDHYPRTGPKVFAGEFAAQSVGIGSPNNKNNWRCALAEAAFMIGLERNSDLVVMSSYAPLFGHVDAWQWKPALIWFDNLKSFGTPSYHVQQLFGANTGTDVIASEWAGESKGLTAVASIDRASGDVIIKIVNTESAARQVHIDLQGLKAAPAKGSIEVLASEKFDIENSLAEPNKLAPVMTEIGLDKSALDYTCPGQSLVVLRLVGH